MAIHHCVTLNQIVNLLKYLPLLIYLSCNWVMQAFNNVKVDAIIQVDYLTHLDVIIQDIHFNEFERFLKLFYNLNVLRIEICAHDSAYLDANRWERLILEHIISLKKFFFSYKDTINEYFHITMHHVSINNFSSSFWIDRKWFFKFHIKGDQLIYLIYPYK